MKRLTIAAAVFAMFSAFSQAAHAQDWFRFEAGAGVAKDIGWSDGTWIQTGLEHHQSAIEPAFMAGFTGDLLQKGNWSLSYHADYIYTGTINVQSMAVADASYDPQGHKVTSFDGPGGVQHNFVGSGHTNGVALLLSPGYNWGKWRVTVDVGPFVQWTSWHETAYLNPTQIANHKTVPQLTWMAGATVARGPFAVSYRYYKDASVWNMYPSYASGAHMLLATYRF